MAVSQDMAGLTFATGVSNILAGPVAATPEPAGFLLGGVPALIGAGALLRCRVRRWASWPWVPRACGRGGKARRRPKRSGEPPGAAARQRGSAAARPAARKRWGGRAARRALSLLGAGDWRRRSRG